ncbi:MAG: DEAD/DEAH box helicase family protein [Coleofasciculaceae cyanobacterium RL_1_1]|nr:DEAD/DEAH box helicase family protein [Coleofasciculaceae cyanobacterium RL_1_1]
MPTDALQQKFVDAVRDRLLAGERFARINQARKLASELWDEPVEVATRNAKTVEDLFEQGVVEAAREIVRDDRKSGASTEATYDRLTELYQNQPRLEMRSSTSILRQQFSTPVAIGYMASRMAGIESEDTVYEPTAGRGALLLECEPERVIANEIDDRRAADLRRQGFTVSENDAMEFDPGVAADVVIANPPFGRRRDPETGRAERFRMGSAETPTTTGQLDQAIAWRALESMADDGRAVLILGSELGDESQRSEKYNQRENRGFFLNLYRNYNVTEHLTVDGKLFERQGAGFPIDLIKIEGRGRSSRNLPAADVPRVYTSYDELKEVLQNAERNRNPDRSLPDASERLGAGSEVRRDGGADEQLLRRPDAGVDDRDSESPDLLRADEAAGRVVDPRVDARRPDGTGERGTDDERPPARERDTDIRTGRTRESGTTGVGASDATPTDERPNRPDSARVPAESERGTGGDSQHDRVPDVRGVADSLREDIDAIAPDAIGLNENETGEQDMATETRNPAVEEQQDTSATETQVVYQPRSRAQSLETLMPRNMASAAQDALDDLEERHGQIDEYVADRLEFGSVRDMHQKLAGEQVDGVALTLQAMEQQQAALIGDQTGVGKGRQLASVIKYAKSQGKTPVFVTKDASLYSDMIRDLEDIGESGFRPFMTNSNEKIDLPDGRTLKTSRNSHSSELNAMLEQGELSDGYDGVFTTYSQLQTVRGGETDRRRFLRKIAPDSILVFDESHEAGGNLSEGWRPGDALPNRAEFARNLVDRSQGVAFASATAIKRPEVMDLYGRKTNMAAALGSVESLQSALENGGIPLQQTATTMLTQDGGYTRREKSYEGIEFGVEEVAVDRDSADGLSRIMASILEFDLAKQQVVGGIDEELKKEAKKVAGDDSIGTAGADSTKFTSIMHNIVDQSLLSRKADNMAEEAIASLERGEKPVLTVSNTMGAFMNDYAEENGIKPGDDFDASFQDVMLRYLERSRDIREKDYDGNETRRQLTDDELGDTVEFYEKAEALIKSTELSFPVSPIDRVKKRIEDAGYSMGEITGRTVRLDYDNADGDRAVFQRRGSSETSKAAKIDTVNNFNSGQTDVVVLNRSGATGISLHASERFENQDRRHMVVGQAERNINDFMQTLGRVNRTGQVSKPKITLMMSDTPDEKRPAAVLAKKMASLNANTTAARQSNLNTSEMPDFFNQYGDQVVTSLMAEYPEVNAKLDFPVKGSEDSDARDGAVAKVTGRLPLLTVDEQEKFYELLESEYASFVEQQKALGNNILEAEALDLDMRPLMGAEVIPRRDDLDSAFASGARAEIADVKSHRKPKTQLEVVNEIREALDFEPLESLEDNDLEGITDAGERYTRNLLERAKRASEAYASGQTERIRQQFGKPENQTSAIDRMRTKLDRQSRTLEQLSEFPLGSTVRVSGGDDAKLRYGAVTGIRSRSLDEFEQNADESANPDDLMGDRNPIAPSKWSVRISLADEAREIDVPLSKVNSFDKPGSISVTQASETVMSEEEILPLFDEKQTGQRELRTVIRGNLLVAAEQFGKDGSIVNATTHDGEIEPAILMDKDFDVREHLKKMPARFQSAEQVDRFFEQTLGNGVVQGRGSEMRLEDMKNGTLCLSTEASDRSLILDDDLQDLVGNEFYSAGRGQSRMSLFIDSEDLEHVVLYLMNAKGRTLESGSHDDIARDIVGDELPGFSWNESAEDFRERLGLSSDIDLDAIDLKSLEASLGEREPEPDAVPESEEIEPETDWDNEWFEWQQRNEERESESEESADAEPEPNEAQEDSMSQDAQKPRIRDWSDQRGHPEKYVGKFLNEAGLAEDVMADPDFHTSIQNRPYMPLSVERQDSKLMLTHFAEENGDMFIDAEMVFGLSDDGDLILTETATATPWRTEARGLDRGFAKMFAKNINDQGFAEVAIAQRENEATEVPETEAVAETVEARAEDPGAAAVLADEVGAVTAVDAGEVVTNAERPRVRGFDGQNRGSAEKFVGEFLESAGLAEDVMADLNFEKTIKREENDRLGISREGSKLEIGQYVDRPGEFHDRAMVFDLSEDGTLELSGTITGDFQGELNRRMDRGVADALAGDMNGLNYAEKAKQQNQYGNDLVDVNVDQIDLLSDDSAFAVPESNLDEVSNSSDEPEPESGADEDAPQDRAKVKGWSGQRGRPEKYVGKFLNDVGLADDVMDNPGFLKIVEPTDDAPFTVGRMDSKLTLSQSAAHVGGDIFIDREMTFNLDDDGGLLLSETAAGDSNGELNRGLDRALATEFAKDINAMECAIGNAPVETEAEMPQEPEPEPTAPPEAIESEPETGAAISDDDRVTVPDNSESESPESEESVSSVEPEPTTAATRSEADTSQESEPEPTATQEAIESEPEDSTDDFDFREVLNTLADRVDAMPEEDRADFRQTLEFLGSLDRDDRTELIEKSRMAEPGEDPVVQVLNGESEAPTQQTIHANQFVQVIVQQRDRELDNALNEPESKATETPSVGELRQWYRAAEQLDRPDETLNRIEAIGQAVKNDVQVVFDDGDRMQADIEAAEEQSDIADSIVGNANRFIGEAVQVGIAKVKRSQVEAEGNHYKVTKKGQRLSVTNKETDAVVVADVAEDGSHTVVKSKGLEAVDADRWRSLGQHDARSLSRYAPANKRLQTEHTGVEMG